MFGAVLLTVAGLAAADTGWRVASLAAPAGLERLVAAAVLSAATVVVEELAVGRTGRADSAVVLTLVALAVAAAARRLLPAPRLGARAELSALWPAASTTRRVLTGAAVGLVLGWIGWQLRHPAIGFDGLVYHLGLAGAWAQGGTPGSIVDVLAGLPVANYPATNEVILAWALALSGGWAAVSIWTPLTLVVLAAGGWLGLRALSVPRLVAGAALAAFCLQPLVLTELGGPGTDVPAATWLVAGSGLCAAARTRPGLLPVAVVAAGLSFGTKTTGTLLLVVVLGAAAWAGRDRLRGLRRALAGAAGVGVVVGGIWPLRNLLVHGSPLWPFVATPWGDPVPPGLARVDQSFLSHPGAMLSGRLDDYAAALAGGVVLLLAGTLGVPLLSRTRVAGLAAGLALLALLAWAVSPYTGISTSTALAVAAARYMLPALAAATVALALAARDTGPTGRALALAVLGVAAVLSATRSWHIGIPLVPALPTLAGVVLLAALLGALARPPLRLARRSVAVGAAAAAALALVGLALGADGYVARHAALGGFDAGILRAAQATPSFAAGSFPIAMGPQTIALLGGDRLSHRVVMLPGDTTCAAARARLRVGWVVLERGSGALHRLSRCLRGVPPRYADPIYRLYGASSTAAAASVPSRTE